MGFVARAEETWILAETRQGLPPHRCPNLDV